MRGKAILVAAFAALLAFGLCACGQQGSSSNSSSSQGQSSASSSASTSSSASSQGAQSSSNANTPSLERTHAFSTMQQVFDAPGESIVWDVNEYSFGFLFKDGTKHVLVRAELPEGMSAQIEAAYEADDMDTIVNLVGPLPLYDEYTIDSPTESQIEFLTDNLTFVQ